MILFILFLGVVLFSLDHRMANAWFMTINTISNTSRHETYTEKYVML